MSTVLFVGPFPPPNGGAAKNTQILAERLSRHRVDLVRINTSSIRLHRKGVKYHWLRMIGFVKNCFTLSLLPRSRCQKAYLVPDGGLGIYYTLVYVILLRFKRAKIFFHHRTYAYVDDASNAMKVLVWASRNNAIHIFLDREMSSRFAINYGRVEARLVGNAATSDVMPQDVCMREDDGKIAIGYLSNLSVEKGFDVVCGAFCRLAEISPNYSFHIAGAPVGEIEKQLLKEIISRLGPRLTYHGQVHGAQKNSFYSKIDAFIFPTRFRQEAQPNVVFEALAAGAFVVATNRGCIKQMLSGVPSAVIEDSDDIVGVIVKTIESETSLFRDRPRKALIQEHFRRLHARQSAQYASLIEELRC